MDTGKQPQIVAQVEPILQKHMVKLHTIWAEGRTAIMDELTSMSQEMAIVLNEDQMRLWEHSLENLPGPIRHGPPPASAAVPLPDPADGGGRPPGGVHSVCPPAVHQRLMRTPCRIIERL
jgi:hypothetical protein